MDAMNMPPGAVESSITGVWTCERKILPTAGGPVLHMLRADSPLFAGFGEIYFSEVEPGAVKGWKRHREQTQTFAVPAGRVEFVLYDGRPDAPSFGVIERFFLGRPDNYVLLRVPPRLWYAFACKSETAALIANLADIPHRPDEADRLPLDSSEIPFTWDI